VFLLVQGIIVGNLEGFGRPLYDLLVGVAIFTESKFPGGPKNNVVGIPYVLVKIKRGVKSRLI
jgi:hypothetical protein